MPDKSDIIEKEKITHKLIRWKGTIAASIGLISGTVSAVFFALEYFETRENAAIVKCELLIQNRINELYINLVEDKLSEFRISGEIWILKQEEPTPNIDNLIETKNGHREEILKRMLVNREALNKEKSRNPSTDCH